MKLRPSWRFALLVVALSTALFIVWPAISAVYRALAGGLGDLLRGMLGKEPVKFLTEKDSYLLIPAIAVILAAQGFPWRRKLAYLGVTFGGLVAFGALATTFEFGSQAVTVPGGSDVSHLPFLLFGVVFPVALVVAFVDGTPSLLWTPSAAEQAKRCPICGSMAPDLRHHVTTAHGPDALRRGDVKRALRA